MSAGIQFSGFMNGHGQGVWFTFGWPNNWALDWTIHAWAEPQPPVGSQARMGLVLPVGAEGQFNGTQSYFLLIQNAGDNPGGFDAVFQFEQF